jgi:uncharacterized surface protein with fasciclin (FAS1) repeats
MRILKSVAFAAALGLAPLAATTANAQNVVEVAQSAGTFETLLAAAEAAGLVDALSNTPNITVFAPSDDAFAALPEGTVESLLLPENQDQLVAILTLHVLPRVLTSNQLPGPAIHVRTLNEGGLLSITKSVDPISVTVSASNTANVVAADIEADNGVIHVIDAVLHP